MAWARRRPRAEGGDWRQGSLAAVLERASDPTHPRPDPELAQEVEEILARVYTRHRLSLWTLLGAAGVLLGLAVYAGAVREHPLIASSVLVALVFAWVWLFRSALVTKRIPLDRTPAKLLGRFTAERVRALVHEVQNSFRAADGTRRLPHIYVIEAKDGNAKVIDTPLLSFLRPFNAVYIHSYLFSVLDEDELRAILTHELAHLHRYMSPLERHAGLEFTFSATLIFWFGVGVVEALQDRAFSSDILELLLAIALFVALVIVSTSLSFFAWLRRGGLHEEELLCDYTAARLVGVLPTVNALLKISLRGDLYEMLIEEAALVLATNTKQDLASLLEVGETALPDRVLNAAAARPVVREALASLRGPKIVFTSEFDHDKEMKERRSLVRGIRRAARVARRQRKLDWLVFDQRVRDARLDELECAALVRALLRHGDARIEVPDEQGGLNTEGGGPTHPIMRDRVLFLVSALPLEGCVAAGSE